jgi:hypothetical protein
MLYLLSKGHAERLKELKTIYLLICKGFYTCALRIEIRQVVYIRIQGFYLIGRM